MESCTRHRPSVRSVVIKPVCFAIEGDEAQRPDHFCGGPGLSAPPVDGKDSASMPELVPVPVAPPVLPMPDQVREVSRSDVEALCSAPRTASPFVVPPGFAAEGDARSCAVPRFGAACEDARFVSGSVEAGWAWMDKGLENNAAKSKGKDFFMIAPAASKQIPEPIGPGILQQVRRPHQRTGMRSPINERRRKAGALTRRIGN